MDHNTTNNSDTYASVFGRSISPNEDGKATEKLLSHSPSTHHSASVHRLPSAQYSPSPSPSTSNGLDEGSETPFRSRNDHDKFIYYDLRQSARSGRTAFVTWLDVDDSGNYDPSGRASCEKAKTKQRRQIQPLGRQNGADPRDGDEGEEGTQNRTVQLSVLAARQRGCSMVVSLKLANPDSIALMQKIPQNWPGMYHNILSDEYIENQVREIINDQSSPSKPYPFRDRSNPRMPEESRSSAVAPYLKDPADIAADLTNHPAARGCAACHALNLVCPLLEDGSAWPCHFCTEDNSDCTLITPPAKKRVCEECLRKRLACSYREEESDPSKPCRQCTLSGIAPCIAGPDLTAMIERKSYERAAIIAKEKENAEPRRYVTCTACRTNKSRCSLKKMVNCPPCASCKREGILCTFLALPMKEKRPQTPIKQEGINAAAQQVLALDKKIPANAKIIHTALCHPVAFLVLQNTCHWCSNPSYGILGLGWVDVTVSPSANGLEYNELYGGHIHEGQERSRICTDCCMSRIAILNCSEHELRPLDGIQTHKDTASGELPTSSDMELDAIEVDAAFDRLLSNSVLPTDRWCHLCPSLALFQCCTPQAESKWGEPLDPMSDEAEGCGLFLCEPCAVTLMDEGTLDGVLERMGEEDEEERWGLGPRADAEFLSSTDNLLMKTVVEQLGVEEEVELG
jgi:hypothetical protein